MAYPNRSHKPGVWGSVDLSAPLEFHNSPFSAQPPPPPLQLSCLFPMCDIPCSWDSGAGRKMGVCDCWVFQAPSERRQLSARVAELQAWASRGARVLAQPHAEDHLHHGDLGRKGVELAWVWVKITPGDGRLVPFAGVMLWVPIFDQQARLNVKHLKCGLGVPRSWVLGMMTNRELGPNGVRGFLFGFSSNQSEKDTLNKNTHPTGAESRPEGGAGTSCWAVTVAFHDPF